MDNYKNAIEFSVDLSHYKKLMEKAYSVVTQVFEYRRSIGNDNVPYEFNDNFYIIEIDEDFITVDMADGYYTIRIDILTEYLYTNDFLKLCQSDSSK